MKWATPRDLLAINPNPALIPISEIEKRFGIGRQAACELRKIATRAPEVMARFHPTARAHDHDHD